MSHDRLNILRDEAAAMTPEFSESLHEKTMARVHAIRRAELSSGQASSSSGDSTSRRPFDLRWFAGMAGACAVAAMMVLVVRPRPAALPPDAPQQFLTAIADIREATAPFEARIGQPIQRARGQLSLLRGDAKEFGDFVFRQIDHLPALADTQDAPAL